MGIIKMTSKIKNDKYTEYVYNAFDIQDKEETTVDVNSMININEWMMSKRQSTKPIEYFINGNQ